MTVIAPSPETRPARSQTAPSVVRLAGLTKRFPVRRGWVDTLRHPRRSEYVTVVEDVTCEIRAGEFFGLLGPNGAGKTTLFKMLSTLILPDAGSARVAEFDVVREPREVRRLLAPVIADERSLNWRLSAQDNLELYAVLQGLRGDAIRTRARELLETVELTEAADRMVGKFSSGMKQRLLIARALLKRPRVLLLDEPTRSLDPISARRFRRFLREEISERHGCTVLLATHNAEEALELCDRVAVLDHGRLLAVGTADSLARDIGEARYRIWTRQPEHPAFARLAAHRDVGVPLSGSPDEFGWTPVEVEVPGGPDRAAEVLALLTEQGVPISTFEPVRLSLADLIERIVQRTRGEVVHA